MKKLSIGIRLTLWYLVLFFAAQMAFGAGMWFMLRNHLYDLVDDTLESQTEDLKKFLASQRKDASITKLQEEVNEAYMLEHSGDYLQLYADDGVLIYRSTFLQNHAVNLPAPKHPTADYFRNRRIEGHPYRFTLQFFEVNGHKFSVLMGAQTDDVVETLSLFRSYLLMLSPLLFLIAATMGYWLSRRALSPVDELVRTARQISGLNLSSRLPQLETGDELQRLADTLNGMLGRIEAAFHRITEFTADASHELRTPISLIRTEAELALRRSRTETEYKESLQHVLHEAERTTALIEQLLALARADSGRETLDLHPVELRHTLRDVASRWQQVATIRNLEFVADVESPDLFVNADEALLRRLVDILLDNAFKYTPTPGSVHLCIKAVADNAIISVRDSGPGIAREEHDKIFERFYRVDKARSRAQGGAGLGLSIASWIVAQHGGAISVDSELGKGSLFSVQLPLIPAPVRTIQPA